MGEEDLLVDSSLSKEKFMLMCPNLFYSGEKFMEIYVLFKLRSSWPLSLGFMKIAFSSLERLLSTLKVPFDLWSLRLKLIPIKLGQKFFPMEMYTI